MKTGRVMWFNESKGFGYIGDIEGREIYFHYTAIRDSETKRYISGGSVVFFDLLETQIGWEAANVRADP